MPPQRISGSTEMLMKIIVVIIDALGAALNLAFGIGSTITNIFGYTLFTFWFGFHKVAIWKGKERTTTILTGLIELIPVVNVLPGLSRFVWKVISLTKEEDQRKQKAFMEQNARNERQNAEQTYGSIVRRRRISEQEQDRIANQERRQANIDA